MRSGPTNSLLDVAGLRVGHATADAEGWLTGTTVVLMPPQGVVAGVDVRGGGPGTRETDLLDPRNLVDRVHAIVLTGGSAFGLAAADGVMSRLAAAGIGIPVGSEPGHVVPIVPAAVVFDLGRGGQFAHRPDADFGARAYDAAVTDGDQPDVGGASGSIGAGTGCVAGGLAGGLGQASAVFISGPAAGATVSALVVVNAAGSVIDLAGELSALRLGVNGEFPRHPPAARGRALPPHSGSFGGSTRPATPGTATTLAVVATDVTLTKAQCAKLAGLGHDGMARAINPVHTMLDGDTVFAVATGRRPAPELMAFQEVLAVAADVVTRAIGHAMLAAKTRRSPAGRWPCVWDWAAE